MSEIHAGAERVVHAAPEEVHALLADYRGGRPAILTDNYRDYHVEEGGTGAGTVVAYRFRAGNRERDYRMRVEEPFAGRELLERDERSSFTTVWSIEPAGDGHSRVKIESSWRGAGGVGGVFERLFAPLGLRRVYADVLGRLDAELHVRHPHAH